MFELDQVTFRRLPDPPKQAAGTPSPSQIWDMVTSEGLAFARAEVFEGPNQWGVRLFDQMPNLEDTDLLNLVKRMLVWDVGCRTDTVEVVLARNHERHMLVRVGGEYV